MQRELCIIIHGFAGNLHEVEPLAHALVEMDYEIITPLLPGHSVDKKRMEKVTALDWLEMIEKMIKRAIEEDKHIHLIGFSMGAMIASIMADRYKIATLVLLSPAVYVLTPHLLRTRLKELFNSAMLNRSLPDHSDNQFFIRSIPIHNVFEFQKIVRQAKRIFRQISVPICILHGEMDETVDPKSSEWIFRVVASKDKELHYLPRSRHHICLGPENDHVIQWVSEFLEKHHTPADH
jgi:Esterase/lipase